MKLRSFFLILPMFACALAASAPAPATQPADRIAHLLQELHDPNSSTVMVVAHRAGWRYAPENSLAGIRKCIAMGADMLEVDWRRTSDGHFVLMHDKTLDRTTTGTGPVSAHTLAEVESLWLKDSHGTATTERVPTLEQVVDLSRGHILIYCDKTEDCIDQMYARLVELKAVDLCVFYGQKPVAQLQKKYGSLLDHVTYLPKIYDITPDMDQYIRDFGAQLHPAAFVIEFTTDGSQVLKEIPVMEAEHARVWASPLWPAAVAGRTDLVALKNPDAAWGWMIKHGVNMFCTDQPQELLTYLREHGLHE